VKYGFVTLIDITAYAMDRLRIIPRIFLALSALLTWRVYEWAMALPDISTQQTVFITSLGPVLTAIFGFYGKASTMLHTMAEESERDVRGQVKKQNSRPAEPSK